MILPTYLYRKVCEYVNEGTISKVVTTINKSDTVYCCGIDEVSDYKYSNRVYASSYDEDVINTLPSRISSMVMFGDTNNNTELQIHLKTIKQIYLQRCHFKHIKELPVYLTGLLCVNCYIESISYFPINMKHLRIGDCPISTLPTLPDTLLELEIIGTRVLTLDTVPQSLTLLHISGFRMKKLPLLPPTLLSLYAINVGITYLLPLPPLLEILDVSYNEINELPPIPHTLRILTCENTNIKQSSKELLNNNTKPIDTTVNEYNIQ